MKCNFMQIANRSCQNFYQKKESEENYSNDDNIPIKNIFKISLYIYYYEKEIKEILDKNDKNFYLINYDWLFEFKKIIKYDNKIKLFSNIIRQINYNNLEDYLERLYEHFVIKNKYFKENYEFKQLTNVNDFIPRQIEQKYYIIPSEIMEVIKNSFFEGKNIDKNISTIKLSYINNNTIIITNENIIKVGILDEAFKFKIQYIFSFYSNEIANSEIFYLKKKDIDINNYIKERGCKPDIYKIQIMKKRLEFSFQEIGKLTIIKNIDAKKEIKENNEIRLSEGFKNKYYSRNINDIQNVQYHTERNSPVKNEINKVNNNNNKYLRKIRPQIILNNKNNINFRYRIKTNNNLRINDKEKEKYSSQTYNNINYKKEEQKIENSSKKEEPKMEEKIIKKEDKDDNYKILEKNMNEKFNNLSKIFEDRYNKIRNHLEENNKVIKKQFDEIINSNKNLNAKFDNFKKEEQNKLEQSQNEIKQLNKQLRISKDKENELYNIIKEKELQEKNDKKKIDDLNKEIEKLKEINKKLEEKNNQNLILEQNNEIEINNENIENNENNEIIQPFNRYYNLINTNIVLSMKKEIKLIGLKNIGQKSFINPFLQCLFQIKPFINYFKNENNINNNLKLASSFKELIMEILNIKEGCLSPEKLIKTFYEINNERKKNIIKLDNIYNFIESILNKLHEELKVQNNDNNEINNRLNKLEFESYKKSIKNEKSIITDLFQGINEEVIKCLSKNLFFSDNSIYNFSPFLFLSFDLIKAKMQQNTFNIFNCFIDMRQKQTYSKEQFCAFCEKKCFMSFQSKILSCPEYLIIMLKYDNENNNNYIKVNFEESLNITNFTKLENYNEYYLDINYNINSIITKVSKNFEAKYITYYKNDDNYNWYRFDNEDIKLIDGNIQNGIDNHEIPLILLYKIV